jgi:hypothetical protein
LLIAGLAAALLACPVMTSPAGAFECPTAQPLSRPGVLKESRARIADLEALLASGDLANRVPGIIDDLRRRYPGIENAEISNYLVATYCPIVARLNGLGDAEKRARIQRFESDVSRTIYASAITR